MFLTSALLAVLSIGVAIYLVNVRVTRELEGQLQREIIATRALVEQLEGTRTQTFTTMAHLIADAPKLKAAVDTNDPPTVQDTLSGYRTDVQSNLLIVTNAAGVLLASSGTTPEVAARITALPSIRRAQAGEESVVLLPQPDGVLQLVTVPIAVGVAQPDVLGTLSVGFLFDAALASQLKDITGSDLAFGMDGTILATTLPPAARAALTPLLKDASFASGSTQQNVPIETADYIALPLALVTADAGNASPGRPIAVILRSRSDQLRVLSEIRAELMLTAVVAVLLATLLSFTVARTITGPLTTITSKMREVAATGDLTRKIVLPAAPWQDADARLLATTFNRLTDSIARIQREMSQKERLSSLGRLSTVIAHEIRNPLMIIKASIHSLRRPDLPRAAFDEATADIDGEITRLNRIVNEVLDFARPIQFELAAADLNAICRESAAAASASEGAPVRIDADRSLPPIVTDAERLRMALVNIIVNARQAVDEHFARSVAVSGAASTATRSAALAATPSMPLVVVSTRTERDHVTVTVSDNGGGIDPDDLARAFDPFFTTRRGGTGLGLPIAKNVVEGLGGIIAVSPIAGGTEVRIDLPFDAGQRRADTEAS